MVRFASSYSNHILMTRDVVFLGYIGWSAGNFNATTYVLVSRFHSQTQSCITVCEERGPFRRWIKLDGHPSSLELFVAKGGFLRQISSGRMTVYATLRN